jgi:hypothetical protein
LHCSFPDTYIPKVELKLPKATFGNWPSLVGAARQVTQTTLAPQQPPKADETSPVNAENPTTSTTKPAPTRKNWDSLAKEIDDVDEDDDVSLYRARLKLELALSNQSSYPETRAR